MNIYRIKAKRRTYIVDHTQTIFYLQKRVKIWRWTFWCNEESFKTLDEAEKVMQELYSANP